MGRGSGPEDPPVAKADDRPDQVGKPTLAGTCLLDRDRDQRHRCRSDVPRGTLDQGPPIARYSLYKPLSALGRRVKDVARNYASFGWFWLPHERRSVRCAVISPQICVNPTLRTRAVVHARPLERPGSAPDLAPLLPAPSPLISSRQQVIPEASVR